MDDAQFFRIAKALADPRRFEILERIAAEREASCAGLDEAIGVSAATVSHHLSELAAAGLVEIRKEGKFGFLTARKPVLDEYLREVRKKTRSR
jgi:ArsR family transcriptional regulator